MSEWEWLDYTHSFLRGSSTLPIPRFQDRPKPPHTDPVTTIIRFEYNSVEGKLPFARPDGCRNEKIDDTGESGQALITFGNAIAAEPGCESWMWARAEEDSDGVFYLFIEWEKYPSLAFSTLSSFQDIPASSPLAAFKPHLKAPPQLSNVPFNPPLSEDECINTSLHIELVTWTIPAHLDPTVHVPQAEIFETIRQFFTVFLYGIACAGPGDLYQTKRGWVAGCPDTYQPSVEEPSEKTHMFLLFWKNRAAEERFKDPKGRSFLWGAGRPGDTREREGDFWEKTFPAWQKHLEGEGMKSENLHLRFYSSSGILSAYEESRNAAEAEPVHRHKDTIEIFHAKMAEMKYPYV